MKIIDTFEIENLGVKNCDVFDIEVQDNHNFFGNDILLHNSVYYQIEPFINDFKMNNPDASLTDCVNFALQFEKTHTEKIIKDTIDQFAQKLNAFDKSKIGAKVEICADSAIFMAKKRYIARVRYDEGTFYPLETPKLKVMGLEIARSTTPEWCKKKLKEAIPVLLDGNEANIKDWINKIKQEYTKQSLDVISTNGGVSSINYKLTDKSIPIGSRACIVYNKYIRDHNLTDKFSEINAGDKVKRIYLSLPNKFDSNIIAYNSNQFIPEIDCVDYDTNFEKSFLSPLEIMTNALKYNLRNTVQDLEDW